MPSASDAHNNSVTTTITYEDRTGVVVQKKNLSVIKAETFASSLALVVCLHRPFAMR